MASLLAEASSGASTRAMASYGPIVHNVSRTLTLNLSACARNLSARLVVSFAIRTPCSVQLNNIAYVGISIPPPTEYGKISERQRLLLLLDWCRRRKNASTA